MVQDHYLNDKIGVKSVTLLHVERFHDRVGNNVPESKLQLADIIVRHFRLLPIYFI
jgi:hypothetical protein